MAPATPGPTPGTHPEPTAATRDGIDPDDLRAALSRAFPPLLRRRLRLLCGGVSVLATTASFWAHGTTGYFESWLFSGAPFVLLAIVAGLRAARFCPRPLPLMWRAWSAGHVLVTATGLMILYKVFVDPHPWVGFEVLGGLMALSAMGPLGAPIVMVMRMMAGLRMVAVDMLDTLVMTVAVLAPAGVLVADPLRRSPMLWLGAPAAALVVDLVLVAANAAFLVAWLPGEWRRSVRRWLLIIGLGAVDAGLQVAQALSHVAVPIPVVTAVGCATYALLAMVPVEGTAVSPLHAGATVMPKLDRLSPRLQVRRRLLTPLVALAGAGGVVAEALTMHRQHPWVPVAAVCTLCGLFALSTAARLLAGKENDLVYRELEVLAGEQRRQALTDALTGLPNRRALEEALPGFVARARRSGEPLSLVMVDIDHFKRYNDRHGHQAGDRLLAAMGLDFRRALRTSDLAARYGGEEFCLVLPGTTVEQARALMEALRGQQHLTGGIGSPVTFSAGVTQWREGQDPDILVATADAALYRAKAAGRNRVEQVG